MRRLPYPQLQFEIRENEPIRSGEDRIQGGRIAEQGYIILAADVSYPLGSMIPRADCGPDYERIPGPMVVIGEATIDEWRAQAKKYLGKLPPEPGGELFFFKVVAE